MKGGMAVVGERAHAAEERVMRVLGIVVGTSSSEDFMMDILSNHRKRWRVRKSTKIDGNRRRVRKSTPRQQRC